MSVRVESVIFCDDVRVEVTGKEIAIGIYTGTILFPAVPVILPNLVVRIELNTGGAVIENFDFVITDPSGNQLFNQKVPFSFNDWSKSGSVSVGLQGMIIPVKGEYHLTADFDGQRINLRSLNVDVMDADFVRNRNENATKMLSAEIARLRNSDVGKAPRAKSNLRKRAQRAD